MNQIYPLAYKLAPDQVQTLYYLRFPQMWKMELLDIARKNNPRFKDEYGLPTNSLKKLIDSWMDGVIALAPLKKNTCDEHWLTSCYGYSERDIRVLCDILKVWVTATYVLPKKISPEVKSRATDFCAHIQPAELQQGQSEEEVRLTCKEGTVEAQAYRAIPLLAVNRLLGEELSLGGQQLHLCYAGKNQLISRPIIEPKSGHRYSFVFQFSVQTTPPRRLALLLCHMSIRRWIPGNRKEAIPYISENINAHISVSENKYCQVPITYDRVNGPQWKSQDEACYNIWQYKTLPPAEEILLDPDKHISDILLPYKNGMSDFVPPVIGTGVSVLDKATLHHRIATFLKGIVCLQPDQQPEAHRVGSRGSNWKVFATPQQYPSCADFRNWVHKCAETDRITFELYGLWNDPGQRELLERIEQKLICDLGETTPNCPLEICYEHKESGDLAAPIIGGKREDQIQRCENIVQMLGCTNTVTACIFLLSGPDHYHRMNRKRADKKETWQDPKQVLRNAFARTGRIVQFIVPEDVEAQGEKISASKKETHLKNRIDHAVYDLYRQLGVVTLPKVEEKPKFLAEVPCVGMHLLVQVHGIANKARFLPIYVAVDILEGKTRVCCDAFSKRTVSYREACLEMAQLFWKSNLEQCCVKASFSPAKQKLIELKNQYYREQDQVLFVVQADGNTRALWGGLSDKEIGGYSTDEPYCPTAINVGTPQSSWSLALKGSAIRIARIRSNQEVPDYFTGWRDQTQAQRSSASGLFQYGDVFWGIHPRPNDPQYTGSFRMSRIDHPKQRFAQKDMIELYPLQLQPGDDPVKWMAYVNALRHIPIQYDQSTVLPLPLHLAKALEEYLFQI